MSWHENPAVLGVYEVGGARHSRTEEMTRAFPTRWRIGRVQSRFPTGPVAVRYDPEKPTQATIRSGVSANIWIWLALATATLALGVGLVLGEI